MKKKPKKKPPKIVTYESSDEEPEPVKQQKTTSRVVRNEPKVESTVNIERFFLFNDNILKWQKKENLK